VKRISIRFKNCNWLESFVVLIILREKARAEPDKAIRTRIVNSTQSFVPVASQVSVTARGINPKLPQTIDTFMESVAAMKQSTLELEESLRVWF
jgi:hypothetical protein